MIECKIVTNLSETDTKLDECASEEEINATLYK